MKAARRRPTERKLKADDGRPSGSATALKRVFSAPHFTPGSNPFLADLLDTNVANHAVCDEQHASIVTAGMAAGHAQGGAEWLESNRLVDTPLAVDVSAGKNEPLYHAHPYHTKIPYQAIVPYIRHYTRPGDVVLDGFCGSGMTGVAAQLAGDGEAPDSTAGNATTSSATARSAILADLSPLAGLLSFHNNTPIDPDALRDALHGVVERATARVGWIYATVHDANPRQFESSRQALAEHRDPRTDSSARWGVIEFALWSDVFECPQCGEEIVYYDMAVVPQTGRVREPAECPGCRQLLRKRQLRRVWTEFADWRLRSVVRQAKRVPVRISYSFGGKRFEKTPDAFDLDLLESLRRRPSPFPFPAERLPPGDESRRNDVIGMTHVHHFYPPASLWALGALADEIIKLPDRLRQAALLVHSAVNPYASWLRRFRAGKKGGGPLSGTLYVSSLTTPANALHSFARNAVMFGDAARTLARLPGRVRVSVQSSTSPVAPPESVDYVFVDPPFGGNLMYAELNFLWEAWLGVFTSTPLEAVENSAVGKTAADYQDLLTACFRRFHEALKPGRWMTVVFHHSRPHVWQAVQAALHDSGFEIVDVRTLDKRQASFKQLNHAGAVRQDLVISTRKPLVATSLPPVRSADSYDVWRFVSRRLATLAPHSKERRDYLLYDRMVADCLRRGIQVPLSAVEFYDGLRVRYREQDGLFRGAP